MTLKVSQALRNLVLALKEIDPCSPAPLVYLAHKARDDLLDDSLAEELQRRGFYGEQVSKT